ncbi:MAG: DNA repair protein RadC [Spiroplasma sp.]|nr:DNA repair protein RadC [Spiroplasma sp.]
MKFKDWQPDKKPREKAIKYGIETLNNEELLAIFLRTGTKEKDVLTLAKDLILSCQGLENFKKLDFNTLIKIKGIGKSKALEIIACFELAKRIEVLNRQFQYLKIFWPQDIFNLVKNYYTNLNQEHFYLLLLNNQNKLIHQNLLYKGTSDTLKIDIKDILYLAISYRSNKIVCVHNHPSGDSEPSFADLKVTNEIKDQLKVFQITLLDHIIIGWENYYSINLNKKYHFSFKKR